MKSFLHRFFIPSHHNNFRAHGLHISSLTVYLIGALVLSFSYSSNALLPAGSVLGIAQDINVGALLSLTNQQRTNSGLPALNLNGQLSSAAAGKCSKMLADNFWAHYAPDGTTPWFFINQSGYKYETAGENLAKDFNDSNSVVNAWMASPTHAANILNGKYQDVGFATCNGTLTGSETTVVVQMFAKPSGSTVATSFTTAASAQEPAPTRVAARILPTTQPTLEPTLQPTVVTQAENKPAGQSPLGSAPATIVSGLQASTTAKPGLVAGIMRSLPKTATYTLFGMLLATLLLDFYYGYKLKTYRVVGKHLAHFIFVAFILLSLLIAANGVIL